MFLVEDGTGPGGLPSIVLRSDSGDARAELLPTRGALLARLKLEGEDVLHLDESTVADPSKSVRGGVPVLFPIAGRLPEGHYTIDGRTLALKQHGFARDLAWDVTSRSADAAGARVACRLAATDDTLAQFPRRFELLLSFELRADSLSIETRVANLDTRELPYQLGFHPYFIVPQDSKHDARVETDATSAFDNRLGETLPYAGMDLAAEEVDLVLLDQRDRTTRLTRGALRPVRMRMDEGFQTLVVWTLRGRDFVCVEPWTAPPGALETGLGLRRLAPGATETLRFDIALG